MKQLKKRMRRYYCRGCKQYIKRIADTESYTSYCGVAGKKIRMIWKPTKEKK